MNKFARIWMVMTLLVTGMLAFPSAVHAQSGNGDDQLVLGDSYTLESDQTLEGSLVVLGGTATIKEGAQVKGDIFIVGGSLDLRGSVGGGVTAVGSVVDISDTAVIEQDLSTIGGTVDRAQKAVVKGHIDIGPSNKFNFAKPNDYIQRLPQGPVLFDMSPIKDAFGSFTRALGMAVLAALLMLFLFKPTECVAQSAVKQPVLSFFLGLLTIVVAPALMVLLIITLIFIPLGLLGLLILGLGMLLGWIAIGYEVGRRVTVSMKVDWAAPVVAAVGTLILAVVSELGAFIPCIGWVIPVFISLMGLGAVVISRFGTQLNNGNYPVIPPPVPPTPPAPRTPIKIAEVEAHDGETEATPTPGPVA